MLMIEFGSRQRGDFNNCSDKDVLILASNWKQIKFETDKLTSEGFSVSSFLFGKATYLIKTGSLFFKHIFDEGILISGSEERFHQLASQWYPAKDYEREIEGNLDLLEVLNFTPSSYVGIAVIVDILISSIRNILIRRLASQGCYVFSWSKIFEEAKKRNMIKEEDIRIFLIARQLKNKYRQGVVMRISRNYLRHLIDGAQRALTVSVKTRFASHKAIRSLPERYNDNTYKQLRSIELVCAEYGFHESLGALRSIVRKPAYFCANG
jgi:predicted nucleotidyltransferase